MSKKEDLKNINKELENKTTIDVIAYFLDNFKNVALSSSLAAEDQVLTDILLKKDKNTSIFTLDTGRLHPETYDVMDATNLKYGIKIDVFFPDNENVQKLYKTQGVNGHYESIENRKNCCNIRKIEPLKRALKDVEVWVTGLRASQSVTRTDMPLVEWDENFNVIKVNPLINWSQEDVWDYIKTNKVPYNKLHDQGFPSIGCAPCTRAIKDGEDIRAGRWWWENPEHKECGLHKK
ncbi:phosphoadenosine phosphosulfate reductase [Aliarcobacter butzleri 7h1h]|uniref:phosphoadenylyl-sulfate reductase n=1 Tax=Aliarcobacter butzleri TaxID=28197 RepID=UPI0002F4775F|nr:phosphoadenylyl-sulfate reductase [Aliarcobacter butzleri]AGR78347.1 phosphoadenosine phosphosulfate reductase [Aliarcobacter butzleri 7h1h]KLE09533.1 phosphoadenosine phosphosulfate reductase [Aliarcobacter butzleri L354]MCG3655051.1 phosphoadenylyl-sulfate reductase [Aliarcobacter butzleri]MCG3695969.1 phosphoadenylyl-sulfate reductase [Aliarcobacter butzleri]MDN5073871.1 phosphoadenylyl-sulfate reductase [Aliarcobacter butzleri]